MARTASVDGDVPVLSYLTQVEAHLLDAFACRDLGDERASGEAAEQALNLAEPDRLILPFAMTGAWQLLETVPPHGTSHAALVTDILDAIRGPGRSGLKQPATPVEELSRSEQRVLRYLPTNLTRREIAGELSVSLNTVDTHSRRIYAKLGAANRTATAAPAARSIHDRNAPGDSALVRRPGPGSRTRSRSSLPDAKARRASSLAIRSR